MIKIIDTNNYLIYTYFYINLIAYVDFYCNSEYNFCVKMQELFWQISK